jgi:hypothetical protein
VRTKVLPATTRALQRPPLTGLFGMLDLLMKLRANQRESSLPSLRSISDRNPFVAFFFPHVFSFQAEHGEGARRFPWQESSHVESLLCNSCAILAGAARSALGGRGNSKDRQVGGRSRRIRLKGFST